jgi:hypothetical protein
MIESPLDTLPVPVKITRRAGLFATFCSAYVIVVNHIGRLTFLLRDARLFYDSPSSSTLVFHLQFPIECPFI